MTATTTSLEQLKKFTTVVVDSSEINHLSAYHAQDATTNPSLVFLATKDSAYRPLIDDAIAHTKKTGLSGDAFFNALLDKVLVNFGRKILDIVPGRVSTEVDARLSFDAEKSMERAHHIIKLYEEMGISKDRILIKLASTWEGVQAATQLEKEGIHCNMTLMFSMPQAVGAANAHATLISPFVGRILDWYKANENFDGPSSEDPGVKSVHEIFNFYKSCGVKTQVMGASFRNTGEILELAGCDLLTISPKLLEELKNSTDPVTQKLNGSQKATQKLPTIDEKTFRWELNENRMATEKLSDGIRKFSHDTLELFKYIQQNFSI